LAYLLALDHRCVQGTPWYSPEVILLARVKLAFSAKSR